MISRFFRARRWVLGIGFSVLAAYSAALGYFLTREPSVEFDSIPTDPSASIADKDFLFGVATSAYQIEGGNTHSDWASFSPHAGVAVDHWNRVEEDLALIEALGANVYRFSLEWSRLEPREDEWDDVAWSHYAGEIERLKAASTGPSTTR
ncbi:MAG: family 1 glycosylhydrolase [Gemmatimonadota bacterium]